jgi:hypothetical protein
MLLCVPLCVAEGQARRQSSVSTTARRWGYLDAGIVQQGVQGTSQGGPLSPLLANVAA